MAAADPAQPQGEDADSGWFAWAMPATAATVPEGEAARSEALPDAGGQAQLAQPLQPQLNGDPPGAHPLHGDVHDLKLSHSMTRAMVSSQADQFNARLDKELANHSKAIGELRSRLYGGAGEPSVMEDVQMIIDVMRRDLNSQRELLMMVNEQIPALREDLTALRRDVDTQRGSGAMKAQPANMSGYVSLQQHEQAFGALQEEMRTLHKATELAAVKAGFLAVASSECSLEEKAKLFDTLKAKEEAIQHGEDVGAFDSVGGSLENAYRSRVAPGDGGRNPMTMPPTSALAIRSPQQPTQQGAGIEFTVRIDKSAGDPLGLQIDHEDGSTLLIDAIHDGLIKWWNEVNPGLAVWPNDRIVAVNGRRGNADMLLRETEQKQVLTLTVMRTNR